MLVTAGCTMLYMSTKKKNSLPQGWVTAGAGVPGELHETFEGRIDALGIQKQRAYAAAMLMFIEATDEAISAMSAKVRAKYIMPRDSRADALSAGVGAALADRRNASAPGAATPAKPQSANRRAIA